VMAPVINVVMMPVLLLSGILLPMTLGPGWLTRISDFMPTRWITDAIRDVFAGDIANGTVLAGSLAAVVFLGLAAWCGTSTFQKDDA
jgi:ABC-2 type transport system permease protein